MRFDVTHNGLFQQAEDAKAVFVFAHGAGAPMDSDFMNEIAERMIATGISVYRFEFPYMAQRREDGKKRPPNKMPILEQCFLDQLVEVKSLSDKPIFIGGKSMGGRVASLLESPIEIKGVICLGYPFHPPGKPDKLRVEHLKTKQQPVLIVQGERDTFGNKEQIGGYSLSNSVQLEYIDDGDHSLKPRKRSGITYEDNYNAAIVAITGFIGTHIE